MEESNEVVLTLSASSSSELWSSFSLSLPVSSTAFFRRLRRRRRRFFGLQTSTSCETGIIEAVVDRAYIHESINKYHMTTWAHIFISSTLKHTASFTQNYDTTVFLKKTSLEKQECVFDKLILVWVSIRQLRQLRIIFPSVVHTHNALNCQVFLVSIEHAHNGLVHNTVRVFPS